MREKVKKRGSDKKISTKKSVVSRSKVYAQIDWEKASKLFQQVSSPSATQHAYPSVKELLHIVAKAGTIGLIFAFPGAAPVLSNLVLGKNSYSRWRTKQIVDQMEKRKLVSTKYNEDGSVTVTITKNGMSRALTYQLETMQLVKPKKWDRRWRLVIFDIPEKYKRVRDLFRMRLKQLGLYCLQESVYVSPFPCFKEIEFLRQLYAIVITVRYLLVEKIEDDEELKSFFELG